VAFDYVAVPWPADAPDPQPAVRQELEDRGFRLLGGCALAAPGLAAVERMAGAYDQAVGDEFARQARLPSQVLAAPDGSAFVQLAWLFGCRYAVFSTVLADGRLLQTCLDWEADPAWPRALARHYRTTDRRTEQLVLATDRDATVVEGGAGRAWETHRERVADPGLQMREHARLEDFVGLYAAESRARSTWNRRVRVVSFLIAFLVVLVPFQVFTVVVGSQPWWVDAAAVGVAGVLAVWLYLVVWLRVRTVRWLRPPFLAPAPAGPGVTGAPTS
jgi:hypothetical protein